MGRFHPPDRRDHHDPRRQRGPCPAAAHCAHPAGCHPGGKPQAGRDRKGAGAAWIRSRRRASAQRSICPTTAPAWKFAEYEMKGVPLRLEVGPRDIEQGQCVLVRRDTREKTVVKFEDLVSTIPPLLEDIQKSLYEKALKNREEHTYTARSLDEMKGDPQGARRLCQVHVVRRSRLRGKGQGGDRHAQPLHAVRAGAHRRCMPGVRQTRQQDDCSGVLHTNR